VVGGAGHSSEHYNNTGRSEIVAAPNRLAVKLEPFAKHLFFYLKKRDKEKKKKKFCSYKAQERLSFENITGSS